MKTCLDKCFLLAVVVSLLSAGCKKDAKEDKNYFGFGESEYLIGSAFTFYMGKLAENDYGKELYLVSEGITFYDKNGIIDSVAGKGNYLVLRIFNTDSVGIAPGDYLFNNSMDDFPAGTFGMESVLVKNFDTSNPDSSEEIRITGGQITIARSESSYEISFDLETEANITIKGIYKGKLKEYIYK